MTDMQARLKPEYSLKYPRLRAGVWYYVSPVFPGVKERRVDVFGRRITRLKTSRDFETVQVAHFEFRSESAHQEEDQLETA